MGQIYIFLYEKVKEIETYLWFKYFSIEMHQSDANRIGFKISQREKDSLSTEKAIYVWFCN